MGVEGARLVYKKGTPEEATKEIKIDGFFLAIGHTPNTEVFKKYIEVDEQGYIITEGKSCKTNVPGVFAAGDVMDPTYRRELLLPEPVAVLLLMRNVTSENYMRK